MERQASSRGSRARDALDDAIEIANDLVIGHPKNAPPELLEMPVPRSIMPLAPLVIAAIDLNDEPHLGASEVDDMRSDDELPPEGEGNLGTGEPPPKPLFGARGREAHPARMLLERSFFASLRAAREPLGARRATAPASLGGAPCSLVLSSRKLALSAARKVRGMKLGARPRRPTGATSDELSSRKLAPNGRVTSLSLFFSSPSATTSRKRSQACLPRSRAGRRLRRPSTNKGEASAAKPRGWGLINNTSTKTYSVTTTGTAKTFEYDGNGNLRFEKQPNGTVIREYRWDQQNRLVRTIIGTHESVYEYDGESKRVRIKELTSSVETKNETFVWCRSRICQKRASNGSTVVRSYFKEGFEEGTSDYVYTRDHLGSVREVVANDGTTIASRLSYDPWGKSTETGSVMGDFGFTGHHFDRPTGLGLTRYRGYEALLGRWLSRDPIGLKGGLNLYGYVNNAPIDFADPTGEFPLIPPSPPRLPTPGDLWRSFCAAWAAVGMPHPLCGKPPGGMCRAITDDEPTKKRNICESEEALAECSRACQSPLKTPTQVGVCIVLCCNPSGEN